ncbi:hypothetical protein DPEC_G00284960 [Dallia pectoralis]|uniref:Uncharacterized protein n=1 Tax=Dallia pectoralis TaxID=75939 RepID=A0ACC2FJN1_DALPE|nr:hypothetical protein DPEC_G00284960 [Dallia pectoralis]
MVVRSNVPPLYALCVVTSTQYSHIIGPKCCQSSIVPSAAAPFTALAFNFSLTASHPEYSLSPQLDWISFTGALILKVDSHGAGLLRVSGLR